jgi:hypothetical protein
MSTNLLQSNNFKIILDKKNYGLLEFNATSVQHPSVSLAPSAIPIPGNASVAFPGDALDFGELTIDFLLDEKMAVYLEIFDWMKRLVTDPYTIAGSNMREETFSEIDITVAPLTSTNNISRKIKYLNCWPTSLSDLTLDTKSDAPDYLTVAASFHFNEFEI